MLYKTLDSHSTGVWTEFKNGPLRWQQRQRQFTGRKSSPDFSLFQPLGQVLTDSLLLEAVFTRPVLSQRRSIRFLWKQKHWSKFKMYRKRTMICIKISVYIAGARCAMLQCSESHIDDKISQSVRDLTSTQLIILTVLGTKFIYALLLYTLNLRRSDSSGFLNYAAHPAPLIAFRCHLVIFIFRRSY